jgi:DNA-binding CsgD family transcriptional regulator
MIYAERVKKRPPDRDPETVVRVIGAAYEAVSSPRGWQDFADTLASAVPDARVSFFIHGRVTNIPSILAHAGWDPVDLADYRGYFAGVSPFLRMQHLVPLNVPESSRAFARRIGLKLDNSEYFNDYVLARRRNWDAVALVLERNERSMMALSLVPEEALPRSGVGALRRLFALLGPHMRRAVTLDRRLAGAAPAGRAATAVLDRLAAAILVLNEDGSLHLANRSGEAMLQAGAGLGVGRHGQLRGDDPAVTAQLIQVIEQAAAARRAGSIDQVGSVVLRREGRQPLSALVLPMPREGSRFGFAGDEGGAVMVVVTDPEQTPAPLADWLRDRFRLTPAEQRLVECLVAGLRLEEAADRLAISRETARTRLKQVMTKTDCDRQAELIRLVLSAPGSLIYV